MPSERNPSHMLTNAQLDDIVDRLLRGKYEKHRPVEPIEAARTGLLGAGNIRSYVVSRWGERSRWSSNTNALSAAGVTMRSNKLAERLQPLIQRAQHLENEELIWRVYDTRSYDTLCYAVGSRGLCSANAESRRGHERSRRHEHPGSCRNPCRRGLRRQCQGGG